MATTHQNLQPVSQAKPNVALALRGCGDALLSSGVRSARGLCRDFQQLRQVENPMSHINPHFVSPFQYGVANSATDPNRRHGYANRRHGLEISESATAPRRVASHCGAILILWLQGACSSGQLVAFAIARESLVCSESVADRCRRFRWAQVELATSQQNLSPVRQTGSNVAPALGARGDALLSSGARSATGYLSRQRAAAGSWKSDVAH